METIRYVAVALVACMLIAATAYASIDSGREHTVQVEACIEAGGDPVACKVAG